MLNENVKKLLKAGMWDLATCAGGKWNSRIICALAALGTLRYSELRKQMGNITDAVLQVTGFFRRPAFHLRQKAI